jgi:predicted CoA-binding protein
MTLEDRIQAFLAGGPFAVVGASRDRAKFGNKVLRSYLQNGREVYPVNPIAGEVEGLTAYPDLVSLPRRVESISVITPPPITETIVEQAGELGIKHIWMQPGAESVKAVQRAEQLGMSVIEGGPCVLVVQGFRE